ncbi:PTS sugar transporter subunit IIC [Marinilactibacillus psychrotolerans]|uniref:Permease IIC component n=1 Tax=Marinilactibacillus psychrotolerans TaxID=191770 RepID=A0A5R9BXH6_9LACT|nr:PTS sugar transporter subunit IIC [Marinilactibacillus psychrotolerans]TLQ04711.1 PTS sugar transporter subunit IIC [Marinilactibacillus psychrotolerans]
MFNEENKFVQHLLSGANKFANQRHISAVKDGFIELIPLTIVASFWVLINNMLLNPDQGLLRFIPNIAAYAEIGNFVYNGTLGVLAILIAFTTGSRLAKSYGLDGTVGGYTGVTSFITLLPSTVMITTTEGETVEAAAVLTQGLTSATGMFLAIIASLVGVTLLSKCMSYDKIKIKMPDSVPPTIAKSFNVLIPIFIVTLILAFIQFIIVMLFETSIPDLITTFFQAPLVGSIQSLPGVLLYVFLSNLLWIFGLHGTSILGSIGEPIMLTSLQQNIDALNAGNELPNIVTKPFIDAFGWMGGGGNLICLVIAILIVSKREDYRTLTKVGIIPSLFNISEPMMFGLPVVFNPLLGLPLIIVPTVTISIAYIATSLNLISRTAVMIPWTTPPILSSFLATSGDYRAVILQMLLIVLGTFIYMPFVRMTNKANI